MEANSDNFIQLKKSSVKKFEIREEDGTPTGEYIEFDIESTKFLLNINKCDILHKKNLNELQNQYMIINKKEDKKGKYIYSWKEEAKLEALDLFLEKEMEALDLFLGKGGTRKLLNGREPYITMYDDISEMLKPVLSKLQINADEINKKIKEKYSNKKEEVEVLE